MHKFKDLEGRTWDVRIRVGEIEAIQELTGIDFGRAGNFERVFDDTKTFLGVLWPCIAGQAAAANLDAKQVKDALDSTVIEAAADAVREELIDFFPKLRPVLTKLTSAIEARAELRRQEAQQQLDQLVEKIATGKLDKALGLTGSGKLAELLKQGESDSSKPAGDSPESAASTPGPTPSEN